MAKFGFKYEVDADNTENQGGGGDYSLMPEMNAVLEASAIDLEEQTDGGVQAKIVFDIKAPEQYAGRKLWAYWIIHHTDHENKRYAKFGKPMFDRLCRAVDVDSPEDTDDLLFREFTAKVGISKGGPKKDGTGNYDDKNEIKTFFYPDQPESIPEPAVLGAVPAANDNAPAARPAAAAPAAKPAGSKPWAKAKAA